MQASHSAQSTEAGESPLGSEGEDETKSGGGGGQLVVQLGPARFVAYSEAPKVRRYLSVRRQACLCYSWYSVFPPPFSCCTPPLLLS